MMKAAVDIFGFYSPLFSSAVVVLVGVGRVVLLCCQGLQVILQPREPSREAIREVPILPHSQSRQAAWS